MKTTKFINKTLPHSDKMDEDDARRFMTGLDGLFSLIGAIAMKARPHFDFTSGQLDFDVSDHIPLSENDRLKIIHDRIERGQDISGLIASPQTAIKAMLEKETSLRPDESRIKLVHSSARRTISRTLAQLVGYEGQVVLPLPNWTFWNNLKGVEEKQFSFSYISGLEPNELIDGFKAKAKKRQVKALLLVSPSNPLGYRIPREICLELDSIATNYGVEVVVDDLLRGNLPSGERESIASYFSKPYVIEGFSHRFGQMPLGELSYVLLPEGDSRIRLEEQNGCSCGEALRLAHEYASDAIATTLRNRNQSFDTNLRKMLPDIEISRPSESSITSIVRLPDSLHMSGMEFCKIAYSHGLVMAPMDLFFPPGHCVPASLQRKVRIGVGDMEDELVATGARILGEGIRYESRR